MHREKCFSNLFLWSSSCLNTYSVTNLLAPTRHHASWNILISKFGKRETSFKLTNIACLGGWETRKLNGRKKQIQEYAWRKQWRISTWVGRIEVSRADKRWSKEPRMLIMESVMLWLFPILSRINCALAANASTSLDIPISKHPSRHPLSHLSVLQWHSATNTTILSISVYFRKRSNHIPSLSDARTLARPPTLSSPAPKLCFTFVRSRPTLSSKTKEKKGIAKSLSVALITVLLLQENDDRPVVIRARLEGAGHQ